MRRGAALVEAAFVLPVCMMFIMGVFEFGRFVMYMQVLNAAATAGARYALTHTQPIVIDGVTGGSTTEDVTTVVNQVSGGIGLESQVVSVYLSDALGNNLGNWTDAQFGQSICVRINGNYRVIGPALLLLPSTLPIQVQSTMRSEAN